MKNTILLLKIIALIFLFTEIGLAQNQPFYNVTAGQGNGLRFWNGNNGYKIAMGNTAAEYRYGPVTNYSIKTSVVNNGTYGFTWGGTGLAPTAALSTGGNYQVKGWLRTMGKRVYFGSTQHLYGDGVSALYHKSNHNTVTQIIMHDKQGTQYGRIQGSGNGVNFGLMDGDSHWSLLAVKDNYTAFRINNSEKMRITTAGKVGIGTTAPVSKFDVKGTNVNMQLGSGNSVLEIASPSCWGCYAYGSRPNDKVIRMLGSQNLIFSTGANSSVARSFKFVSGNAQLLRIQNNGEVNIGNNIATPPGYKLYVDDGILTEQVKVANINSADWADFVFAEDFDLNSTKEVEAFIQTNKHLPNVPSAKEVSENGVNMVEMDATLLRQIEELWLHVIELKKETEQIKAENQELKIQLSNNK